MENIKVDDEYIVKSEKLGTIVIEENSGNEKQLEEYVKLLQKK